MNTSFSFKELHKTIPRTGSTSIFIFEELKYFDCMVNGEAMKACIYAHEMLLLSIGFWVSFTDGSHFLMCTDSLSDRWITLIPEGEEYADAVRENMEAFFQDNYDKLSTVCIG